MRRRALLAAAAAGATSTAGCLDRLDGDRAVTSYDCPPFEVDPDDPDQSVEAYTVCSHTVDPDEASVYAVPSRTSVASVEGLTFTVYNDWDESVTYDGWRLSSRGGGEWVTHSPAPEPGNTVTIGSGATETVPARGVLERFGFTPPIDGTFAATAMLEPPEGPPVRVVVLFRVY